MAPNERSADDEVYLPLSESGNTFFQVSLRLIFRICDCQNIDVGKSMADESTQMLWEGPKGIVAALKESVLSKI